MPGNSTDNPETDSEPTSANVFALVGNEIRTEIIQVLGEAYRLDSELRFSDLRSRMDSELDPPQLHYHVNQLVGHFVEKTNDGYRLRGVGYRLYEALRAGTFDRCRERLSIDADVDCYYCRAPLEVTFEDGKVSVACTESGHGYMGGFVNIPIERFEEESTAFSYFRKYSVLKCFFMASGVCPSCANSVNPRFCSYKDDPRPIKVKIFLFCDLCGTTRTISVGTALLADPGLIAFCYNHGVDVLSTPWWEFEFAATDESVTVRSTDPWKVALEVTFNDETLELVVDGDLNILERNKRSTPDQKQVILPDTVACIEALNQHRWPDEVICPYCNSADIIKKGTTQKGAQRYRCHNCDRSFNDLSGTMFAERGLSLSEMFYILMRMDEVDTAQIARQLDRSYKSVLTFVHDVRAAFKEDSEVDPRDIREVFEISMPPDENGDN